MKFHILLLFYLLVVKTENIIFTDSLHALVRKKMFSPLKRKIYIFAPPLVCDSGLISAPLPPPSLGVAEKHSRLISEAGLISLLSHTTPCLVPRRLSTSYPGPLRVSEALVRKGPGYEVGRLFVKKTAMRI